MALIRRSETLTASTEVRTPADQVYSVVSDVTRIPECSPKTTRAQWVAPDRFQACNRRHLGRWRTIANVVEADPGQRFSFVVQALGGDWMQWTYLSEPRSTTGATRLTEVFRMCVPLPWAAVVFEHIFLVARDRRADLQRKLDLSVNRIRSIVEAGADA